VLDRSSNANKLFASIPSSDQEISFGNEERSRRRAIPSPFFALAKINAAVLDCSQP
jgi:hypothetical protein